MSQLMTTQQFNQLLLPGMFGFHGMNYRKFPAEWPHIFATKPSFRNFETELELAMLGNSGNFNEGGRAPISSMSQGPVTVALHQNVGIGFQITRNMIRDNLYPSIFPKGFSSCENSQNVFKEIQGMVLFNNAFDATKPIADGKPLCSTTHPLMNGQTFSNTLAYNLDLNETAVNDVNILRAAFQDPAGLPYFARSKFLLVSPKKQYQAEILCGTKFRPGTNMNDISPTESLNIFPGGYLESHYMLSSAANNWFDMTDTDGFLHFDRQPNEPDMFTDPYTGNFLFFLTARYSYICTDSRAVIGVQGL